MAATAVAACAGEVPAEAGFAQQGNPGDVVLENATVIDVSSGEKRVANVVVVGGRIQCVGGIGECAIPPGARRLDLRGRWILPGLIDTHAHMSWRSAYAQAARDQSLRFALGTLTVRDAGSGLPELDAALEARRRAGGANQPEPRIVLAGLLSPDMFPDPTAPPAEIVEFLLSRGVDAIKIKGLPWSNEEAREAVQVAVRAGVPVFGHTWRGPPPEPYTAEAVEWGVAGICHLFAIAPASITDWDLVPPAPDKETEAPAFWRWRRNLWLYTSEAPQRELAELMIRAGVYLEPTLFFDRYFFEEYHPPAELRFLDAPTELRSLLPHRWIADRLRSSPEDLRVDEAYDRLAAFVLLFKRLGGRVVTGSDAIWPGPDLREEIVLLEDAGFTRLEALQAATRDAAIVLEVDDDLGTIEVGKIADLLVLRSDPLEGLDALLDLEWIVKGGVLHDPEELLDRFRLEHRHRVAAVWRDRSRRFRPLLLIGLVPLIAALIAVRWRRSASRARG